MQADLGTEAVACDALLVTHLTNIRYLSGFTGSAALLLVLPGDAVLVTDGRYEEQAADELRQAGVVARVEIGRTLAEQREMVMAIAGEPARVGLEADHVSWADQGRYARDWFPGSELVPTSGLVEAHRLVKDDGEVARIEVACAIADAALASVAPTLDDGPTEVAFALRPRHRDAAARRRRRVASRRSWPPGRTGPGPTTRPPTASSDGATSW